VPSEVHMQGSTGTPDIMKRRPAATSLFEFVGWSLECARLSPAVGTLCLCCKHLELWSLVIAVQIPRSGGGVELKDMRSDQDDNLNRRSDMSSDRSYRQDMKSGTNDIRS